MSGSGQVEFDISELFFSRTSPSGIILAGNGVFQRVSGYSWPELLEKPHKLIRHPDVPRAVFWLLWASIGAGRPIGAYVKNRAKDGRHYWVFAIVTPIEDGYLSVRLKPSSSLLPVVADAYAECREAELGDVDPEVSAGGLLQLVGALGFRDYGHFMAVALKTEVVARLNAMGAAPNRLLASFDNLMTMADDILKRTSEIAEAFAATRHLPLNFRILSAQQGRDGAPISVVSSNHDYIAQQLNAATEQFTSASKGVFAAICDGLFLTCTAQIQREVLAQFEAEGPTDGVDVEQETRMLNAQQLAYAQAAQGSLREIARQAATFRETCVEMKRLTSGLEVTRILAKMEYSRLSDDAGMGGLLDDLQKFQETVAAHLRGIEQDNAEIANASRQLLSQSHGT